MKNNILVLILIKQWFADTFRGLKKEEYRAITPYWLNRFMCMENGDKISKVYNLDIQEHICNKLQNLESFNLLQRTQYILSLYDIKFKNFDATDFRNGYKSLEKVPRFIIENKGITIGRGNPEWGYTGENNVFIIHHGEILESFNIK